MDSEAKLEKDLQNFLRKALEIEQEEPDRVLNEDELKRIALKCGLTEEDWKVLQDRLSSHLDRGRNFLEFGNHDDAIRELEEAAVLAPYRIDVLYDCGQAHVLHWQKNKNEESRLRADELFEQCLLLEPGHKGAARELSQVRQKTDAGKKGNRRILGAVAAAIFACGGMALFWNLERPVPDQPKALPETRTNLTQKPGSLRVQRSGNVIAIPRFSSILPAFPKALPSDIVQIQVGFTDNGHVLALRKNGEVIAWGANTYQQAEVPEMGKAVQVGAGWRHSLALLEDGTVVAWGDNEEGQCDIPRGLTDVIQISAGVRHSVALRKNGTVVAWGGNHAGQCNVPPDLGPVVQLAEICGDHTVVITAEGKLAAWGKNEAGESVMPNAEIGDVSVIKVWAGGGNNYVLLDDHRLLHWGRPLRDDQLPREMTGVADVFSGYTATVLIRKTNHTTRIHGSVKDHPKHDEVFRGWEKIFVGPGFIYGLLEEEN